LRAVQWIKMIATVGGPGYSSLPLHLMI